MNLLFSLDRLFVVSLLHRRPGLFVALSFSVILVISWSFCGLGFLGYLGYSWLCVLLVGYLATWYGTGTVPYCGTTKAVTPT